MNNYDLEVEQRWGETDTYKEHAKKSANYQRFRPRGITEKPSRA